MIGQSIPDRFVEVVAAIRALEPKDDDPMRYVMWSMQEEAFRAIGDAINQAQHICGTARMLQRDLGEVAKEIAAKA